MGFTFGRRPGAADHIKAMRRLFGARAWMLRHLRRAGIDKNTLVRVYTAMIRPVLEYLAPAFDSLLTQEQSDDIERMQSMCLKIIYGFEHSYRKCLEEATLPSLKERRKTLFEKFAVKCWNAERWRLRWFPLVQNPDTTKEAQHRG